MTPAKSHRRNACSFPDFGQEILRIHEGQHPQVLDSGIALFGLTFALLWANAGPEMTLRIERFSARRGTRIRLSGELRNEQLNDLRTEIERSGPQVTLDLDELNLVDIDAVRFLNAWVDLGVKVVNCSLYIREWMHRERTQKAE